MKDDPRPAIQVPYVEEEEVLLFQTSPFGFQVQQEKVETCVMGMAYSQ